MSIVVIGYLYGALLLYLVTGGADFGAGIIELFTPASEKIHVRLLMRKLTSPIWEADHMWLILAVVILFVGFPDIYAQISTSLFIPMTIMLLGIVGRGTSYAFRNADNVHDRFKTADNIIYIGSSIVTPFFLGIIASAVFSGGEPNGHSFTSVYLYNWFNYFSISTGTLTVLFCGYLATIYTLARFPGERHPLKFQFALLSLLFFVSVPLVVFNPVFATMLPIQLAGIPLSAIITVLTAIILYVMWKLVYSNHSKWARLFALLPVIFILLVLSHTNGLPTGSALLHLPLYTNSEFSKTINALGIILIICSFLIIPALGYLLYKFELPHYEENNFNEKPN